MYIQSILVNDINILIARDDLNHGIISGNKLHKLKPNIELAINKGYRAMLSFGGPFSNHLHALAWACKENKLKSIGVVRGELHQKLTPTLQDCKNWGMQLIPCSRKHYRAYQDDLALVDGPLMLNRISPPENSLVDRLVHLAPNLTEDTLVIPEGGSNLLAIESVAAAYRPLFDLAQCKSVTHAICATGTGATVSGLSLAAPKHVEVIGVQTVAEGAATSERIQDWITKQSKKPTIEEGHLGGFAKTPAALMEFIDEFEARHNIPLDPIYNGKVMYKVSNMITEGEFKQSDVLLIIHTGGLQGKRSKS